MSDRDDPPTDLFDAVCRLDDVAEWLEDTGYTDEATQLRDLSWVLKSYIEIRLADAPPAPEAPQ